MHRMLVFSLLITGLAACSDGVDDSSPCGSGPDVVEFPAHDGTIYCLPEAGSGLALCLIEDPESSFCTTTCPPEHVLAALHHPYVDGAGDSLCYCLAVDKMDTCNQQVPDDWTPSRA